MKFWTKVKLIGIGVTLLCVIIASFELVAEYLYSNTEGNNPKGSLATTYLSIIGGLGVIYGFIQTSRKIGEQTRQNDLSDKSNNDKRFGDAIGYLNSENLGIAIGGAYVLFQLVKEDREGRYKNIVANIYLNFLSRDFNKREEDELYNTIIQLILNDEFKDIKIEFVNVSFKNRLIIDCNNRQFTKCIFDYVRFVDSNNCCFSSNCIMRNVNFSTSSDLHISHCSLKNCSITNTSAEKTLKSVFLTDNSLNKD